MFEDDFYLGLLNVEFKAVLQKQLKSSDLGKNPRILLRIEEYFDANPLKSGKFSHYRPARQFHENLGVLTKSISDATKDRFEAAFKDLNKLL